MVQLVLIPVFPKLYYLGTVFFSGLKLEVISMLTFKKFLHSLLQLQLTAILQLWAALPLKLRDGNKQEGSVAGKKSPAVLQ